MTFFLKYRSRDRLQNIKILNNFEHMKIEEAVIEDTMLAKKNSEIVIQTQTSPVGCLRDHVVWLREHCSERAIMHNWLHIDFEKAQFNAEVGVLQFAEKFKNITLKKCEY